MFWSTKTVCVALGKRIGPAFKILAVELAESNVNKCGVMLNVGLTSFRLGSIAATYSEFVTSATDEPSNESTTIPFLNRGKFVESKIVKSCLFNALCSSKESEV